MPRKKKTKRRRRRRKKTKKIKLEKCAPRTKDETLDFTCYTKDALEKMKNVWNSRHPDVKILETNVREIWKKLKSYMSTSCNKESCWLRNKEISSGLEKSILNNTFAPYQPMEWKKNPYEWLSSVDIQKVMKQYENTYKCFDFIGPSPIDFDEHKLYGECVWEELCKFNLIKEIKKGKNKIGIIFNTDPHTKSGAHWIALFINAKKKKIVYMDSYGDKPPKEINALAKRIQIQSSKLGEQYEYVKTNMRHQYSNSECGMYCLYFIIQSLKDKSWTYFNNHRISDKKMKKLRKIYFNVK
jgi:hypothetical protein